jgi:hypothetical protein
MREKLVHAVSRNARTRKSTRETRGLGAALTRRA